MAEGFLVVVVVGSGDYSDGVCNSYVVDDVYCYSVVLADECFPLYVYSKLAFYVFSMITVTV